MFELGGEPGFSTCYRLIKEHISALRAVRGNKRGLEGMDQDRGEGPSGGKNKRTRVVFEG
jgi:hypothetical protein